MVYQTLLRHRELPVMPMILRISRASIPSQTVMPCNLIATILSVGLNHLGSYLISPSVNTSVSPAKNHLYSPPKLSTRRLWNLAIQRKILVCGCQAILPRTNRWLHEQCAKATKLLGFVRRASRYIQSTQARRTLYLSIVRCHLGYATQVWSPQSISLLKRVENVQLRATKLILKLLFRCDVTYKTRLQVINLLPISYWHEFLDIVFFYKAVDNLVLIDSEALPATRQSTRSTRSSSSNAITYIPKRSRTVTYQRSFFIRACRTWNVLPAELRTSHISLASFKRSLLQYYNKALDLYDVDDIRTWRTICPRCNIARTLLLYSS